jgi:outer membrane protein OmpA-like peptidoglycan-associated protein
MSRVRTWIFLATALGGCAMTPQANHSLDRARQAYSQAQAHPDVQARAPVELQVAQRQLAEAERLWNTGGADPAAVSHLAYLAEQRANIAMQTAQMRRAEAAVATAGNERNRVLLEARTREAEASRLEAEASRLQAEAARSQAMDEKRAGDAGAALLAEEVRRLQTQVSELRTQQTGRGWVLTLANDVLFDSGRATLKPGAQKAVENLAQFLLKQADREITIEGFTDATGSDELNRRLSEQRADAVKRALVARGIEADRIDTRGYGPAFPVASNDSAVGRQLNRRVQVVVAPEPRLSSSGSAPASGGASK